MTACTRFEQEGLAAIEAGQPLDDHFTDCPTCRAELDRYRWIQRTLAETGDDRSAPPGWQARVWRTIGRDSGDRRRYGAIAAVAAALLVAVLLVPQLRQPALQLDTELEHNREMTQRTLGAQQGDTWRLSARLGSRTGELRIYLDGELLASCSDGLDCRREGRDLAADYVVERLGVYDAVVVRWGDDEAVLSGGLEQDRGAVEAAGGEMAAARPIEIR